MILNFVTTIVCKRSITITVSHYANHVTGILSRDRVKLVGAVKTVSVIIWNNFQLFYIWIFFKYQIDSVESVRADIQPYQPVLIPARIRYFMLNVQFVKLNM